MAASGLGVAGVSGPAREGRIFVWLAGVQALTAFAGFAPTYWLQLPGATFDGSALLHLHAVLFSAWTLLIVWQSWLASRGELRRHRAFGLAGVSLASLMVLVGLATAVARVHQADATSFALEARRFLIVQVSAMALFAGLVTAAIVLARRPGWHPRLMVAATASLLQAAVARLPFLIVHGTGPGVSPSHFAPPPLGLILAPEMSVNLFLAAGLIHDIRTRGRPHPAWPVGLAAIAIVTLARDPLAHTAGWLAVADDLARFAG
ncbi:MAG TPA: hypothetical protein VGC92_13660 [Phenylobacterium sp.]|jgi:hypothetical protein